MGVPTKLHKVSFSQILPLVLIGLGLIVFGMMVLIFARDENDGDTPISVVPARVNYPAPDLSLNNLNGELVSLTDYHQDIVLINNWATWCPPCKSEMPILLKFYHEHAKQGFMLIGIDAGDPREQVVSFVDDYGIDFPILLDPNTRSLIAFNNDSLPSSYVIDHDGHVVLAWTGPISQSMLEKYVTPLLEQ